jgi:hypothetical protein
MCSNAKVQLMIMIRPYVSCKANAASGLLCQVLVELPIGISNTGTYCKFFLKLLEPCLPCLDNSLANLCAVWDVFILNILTKEKKQIMKLWTFNDIDRLSIRIMHLQFVQPYLIIGNYEVDNKGKKSGP